LKKEDARQAGEVGAAAPPTDVDTTGSSQEVDPQAAMTAPEDWTQNPYVHLEGASSLASRSGQHLNRSLNEIKELLRTASGEEKRSLQTAKKLLEQSSVFLRRRKTNEELVLG